MRAQSRRSTYVALCIFFLSGACAVYTARVNARLSNDIVAIDHAIDDARDRVRELRETLMRYEQTSAVEMRARAAGFFYPTITPSDTTHLTMHKKRDQYE